MSQSAARSRWRSPPVRGGGVAGALRRLDRARLGHRRRRSGTGRRRHARARRAARRDRRRRRVRVSRRRLGRGRPLRHDERRQRRRRAADADAWSQVTSLSLFGGEITAASVTGEAHARATPPAARATSARPASRGSSCSDTRSRRRRTGRFRSATGATRSRSSRAASRRRSRCPRTTASSPRSTSRSRPRTAVCPAGSELQIGYAEANAQAGARAPLPPAPSSPPPRPGVGIPPLLTAPPSVTPPLGQAGYVFPVYGPSEFVDTFGAFRGDVPGGWHHGDDIFAPVGTPLLAVADGARLLRRVERRRRLASLAPRRARERVLLRASLRVLAARRRRRGRARRRRARLRRRQRRRRGHAVASPLRDPPGAAARPRLRRRGRPDDVSRPLAAGSEGRSLRGCRRADRLGPADGDRAEARCGAARADGHLRRGRPYAFTEGAGGPLLPRLQPPAEHAPVRP